jgi:hypothetical protein
LNEGLCNRLDQEKQLETQEEKMKKLIEAAKEKGVDAGEF